MRNRVPLWARAIVVAVLFVCGWIAVRCGLQLINGAVPSVSAMLGSVLLGLVCIRLLFVRSNDEEEDEE